jgi:tRNA1Val (adenine37-N6)-methyltransferase
MSKSFVFKQFELEQGKAAFKLGTDSVLLGSWLPERTYKRILDLGAGTGILGLMMAQRFSEAHVWGIEIDQLSSKDCANNFSQSPWRDRLNMVNEDIVNWSNANPREKFDLLITNPPYFRNSLLNPDHRKSIARHSGDLTLDVLADLAKRHLLADGCFGIILPSLEFDEMKFQLEERGMYSNHICLISSFENTDVIRKMGVFSYNDQPMNEERHYLYHPDKSRSAWYALLSEDFYIK